MKTDDREERGPIWWTTLVVLACLILGALPTLAALSGKHKWIDGAMNTVSLVLGALTLGLLTFVISVLLWRKLTPTGVMIVVAASVGMIVTLAWLYGWLLMRGCN